jgi:hypothetical protein
MENKYVPTGKTYHIKNFDQLINVATVENMDMLSCDFYIWLNTVVLAMRDFKEKNPKFANKPNSKIVKVGFTWLDDGKNDMNGVKLTNSATGEETQIVAPHPQLGPPTFTTALEWLTEYFEKKLPEFPAIYQHPVKCQAWADDFTEYYLHDNEMTGPFLTCESIEITEIPIFRFIIPATKEQLFTLLEILDK